MRNARSLLTAVGTWLLDGTPADEGFWDFPQPEAEAALVPDSTHVSMAGESRAELTAPHAQPPSR